MGKDDLTKIKYIGASRMNLLYNHGITTIKQLANMTIEEIAQIETLGIYTAELIKSGIKGYYDSQEIIEQEEIQEEEKPKKKKKRKCKKKKCKVDKDKKKKCKKKKGKKQKKCKKKKRKNN